MKLFIASVFVFILSINSVFADKKVNVVTSTEDLADLVRVAGSDKVSVISLSRGNQDPHFVEPRPSMVIELKKADMLVKIGMDLDIWVDSLIDSSRNSRIVYGAKGYVDASVGISRLEIPEKVDASMGHIHIFGNPHYQTDPANAKIIINNIVDGLIRVLPEYSDYFKKNAKNYIMEMDKLIDKWEQQMKPYEGANVVTYHNSWPYFAKRFKLNVIGHIEPKPGIPPSPLHITSLIDKMKHQNAKIIMVEPYYDLREPQEIAKKANAKVVVLAPSVGGIKGIKTFTGLFEYNIDKLVNALRKQ